MSSPETSPLRARVRAAGRALLDPDALLVIALLGILAYALYETASWRMKHDLPMMMYQAFAMNRLGLEPYRDFFDMNMPGTYATYRLIGAVYGYGDQAIRFADWTWLAFVWATTLLYLRGFPARVKLAGLALFSLTYLRFGAGLTLQREFLALPLLALGVAAAFSSLPHRRRALLAGIAFGVAATFKPHLVIGAVPVAAYLAWEVSLETPRAERMRTVAPIIGWGAVGIAIPALVVAAWLTVHGLWGPFLRSLQYLAYYGQLDGAHVAITAAERPLMLLENTLKVGGHLGLLLGSGFGLYVALTAGGFPAAMQRRILLIALMVGFYVLYPAGSGQFWNYHWLPMVYFASLCAGFLLSPAGSSVPRLAAAVPRLALVLFVIQLVDVPSGLKPFRYPSLRVAAEGRPEKIARFLVEHLEPGDVVQPYDWVAGGVVQGMLMAKARPATPYFYTFHFYHHISTPYIRGIQRDFMSRLEADPPAFVVVSRALWPFVRGPDTTREFPAFDAWLEAGYQPALRGNRLTIWERTDHMEARGGTPAVPASEAITQVPEGELDGADEGTGRPLGVLGLLEGVVNGADASEEGEATEGALPDGGIPDDGGDGEGRHEDGVDGDEADPEGANP